MGIRTVLRDFRQLVEAIQDLVGVLRNLRDNQREAGPALDRVTALELSRHQFEAECAGALLEAKGKLKGALSSEARERHMRKQSERDADPLGTNGDEVEEAGGNPIVGYDAAAREAERLPALRLDVAPGGKEAALNHKFGR